MDNSYYMEILQKGEIESKTVELKSVDKITSPDGIEKILTIIVGMANRDGGYILIGINDNGTPEGKNIFNRFESKGKSGIDKIKEKVMNMCMEKTSPIVNIDFDFCEGDDYEFLSIIIPKKRTIPHAFIQKKGDKIYHRDYYIKNSHSCTLVSDSQLEWLFNVKNKEDEIEWFYIDATIYKDMGGVPYGGMEQMADWLIIQPRVINEASRIIHKVFDSGEEARERLLTDHEFKSELFHEIILYSVMTTVDGYGSRGIPLEAKEIPSFPESFLLPQILGDAKGEVFNNRIFSRIVYPDKTDITYYKNKDRNITCQISNDYCDIKVSLYVGSWKRGISGNNPYFPVMFSTHLMTFQNETEDLYEAFGMPISIEIHRKFPDVMDDLYNNSIEFYEKVKESIKNNWDMNYFLKEQHPHYKKFYTIEHKVDILSKKLNDILIRENIVQRFLIRMSRFLKQLK